MQIKFKVGHNMTKYSGEYWYNFITQKSYDLSMTVTRYLLLTMGKCHENQQSISGENVI